MRNGVPHPLDRIQDRCITDFCAGDLDASAVSLGRAMVAVLAANQRLTGLGGHSGSSQGTMMTQTIRTMMDNGTPTRTKSPNV